MKAAALALSLFLGAASVGHAEPGKDPSNQPDNGSGQHYALTDGASFSNAGAMLQHLRNRDNGYASGNPKDVVEAYPNEFDSVGDLIQQKRVD